MKCFEYLRLEFDWGDLDHLCSLASMGWHVVAQQDKYLLLERELTSQDQILKTRTYWQKGK